MAKGTSIKAISKAFNSSMSFDEFNVQLDLLGLSIDKAQDAYSEANGELLKYKTSWCTYGKIDFAKMFKLNYKSIVLPYCFEKSIGKLLYKICIKAIAANGHIVMQSANLDFDLQNGLLEMYGINAIAEIVNTLLYELSVECCSFRAKGIGHGKI